MTLTAVDRAEMMAYLKEAKATRHSLMMGQQAREFTDQNGERITFTAANLGALNAYIRDLEMKLGLYCGGLGPLGFVF